MQADDGSGNLLMQVYHAERDQGGSVKQYIDEIVAMRLEHGRAYVHQDANWNVIALTDLKGATLERTYYSPYGQLEVTADTYFGDYDGDGYVDADDDGDLCTTGCACPFTASVTGDCRVFDFDSDGDLDQTDQDSLRSLYQGLSSAMQNRRIRSVGFSPAGNPFAHQGLVLDPEIGSYQNRARQYNPKLNRFMQRDPLLLRPRGGSGYQDGMSLYAYVNGNPVVLNDAWGLTCPKTCRAGGFYGCSFWCGSCTVPTPWDLGMVCNAAVAEAMPPSLRTRVTSCVYATGFRCTTFLVCSQTWTCVFKPMPFPGGYYWI